MQPLGLALAIVEDESLFDDRPPLIARAQNAI